MKLKKFLSTSSFILMSTPALAGLGDPYDTVVMCRTCPAGTWGNGSATTCTNCAAGTYQDKVGQGECINCGKGRYQNATGQTGCKNCGKGYYCPNEKTVNPIPVDTGYCAKTDKESAQTACASNASSSYPGVKTCNKETCAVTSCNAGYGYSNGSCVKCTGTTYSTGGTMACTSCGTGVSACNNSTGQVTSCSAGYGYSSSGRGSCSACTGSDYSTGGTMACTYCDTSRPSCTKYWIETTSKIERITKCPEGYAGGSCMTSQQVCAKQRKCYYYERKHEEHYGTGNTRTPSSCSGYSAAECGQSTFKKPDDYCDAYEDC